MGQQQQLLEQQQPSETQCVGVRVGITLVVMAVLAVVVVVTEAARGVVAKGCLLDVGCLGLGSVVGAYFWLFGLTCEQRDAVLECV